MKKFARQGMSTMLLVCLGCCALGPSRPVPPSGQPADANGMAPAGTGTANASKGLAARCPRGPYGTLPATNTSLRQLNAPAADHLEGPVWVGASLLFSAWDDAPSDGMGPPSRIMAFTPPASFAVFSAAGHVRSNGLAVDSQGRLWAATHDRRAVSRLSLSNPTQRSDVANGFGGKPFNAPNDLVVRSDGTVYMTDPDYQADGRASQARTRVYRIDPAGSVHVVDAERDEPNGIALSTDEAWLYVGGRDRMVMRYAVTADGSTAARQPFVALDSDIDGMAVDCANNLYVAAFSRNELQIFSPDGALVQSLAVPESPTNAAFGGSDMRTLFVTTVKHLYTATMPVPGLPN